MATFPQKKGTVISGIFTRRTSSVELDTTDSADVVLGHIPAPRRYRVPLLDRDLHFRRGPGW